MNQILEVVSDQQRRKIISEHMKKLGRKGGKANAGTEKRRTLNKRAAISRWRRLHPAPKKVGNSA